MEIIVTRNHHTANTTGSIIYLEGATAAGFICYGIEPGVGSGKGPIPAGLYKVGIRTVGEFHAKYAARFPYHVGMLEVLGVPGFEAILLHCGNSFADTKGCLLLGRQFKSGVLFESEKAYTFLYNTVIAAAMAGNLSIEYR
jgi:hypothetical protein